MLIIFTEKPHLSKTLAPHARNKFPNEEILILNSMPFNTFIDKYPQHLKWDNFPIIQEPVIKMRSIEYLRPHSVNLQGKLEAVQVSVRELKKCDKIIFATWQGEALYFEVFLKQLGLMDKEILALNYYALDTQSLNKAFNHITSFRDSLWHILEQRKIKKYFDYNFNLNSSAILGRILKNLGIDENMHHISKYGLQIMYFIFNTQNEQKTIGNILGSMHKWIGTGTYSEHISMGSATSRLTIIEQLITSQLLKNDEGILKLTHLGVSFLSLLHKDCQDQDLPFKLSHWEHNGLKNSKPKMDQYLIQFFGKQKKILDRN